MSWFLIGIVFAIHNRTIIISNCELVKHIISSFHFHFLFVRFSSVCAQNTQHHMNTMHKQHRTKELVASLRLFSHLNMKSCIKIFFVRAFRSFLFCLFCCSSFPFGAHHWWHFVSKFKRLFHFPCHIIQRLFNFSCCKSVLKICRCHLAVACVLFQLPHSSVFSSHTHTHTRTQAHSVLLAMHVENVYLCCCSFAAI